MDTDLREGTVLGVVPVPGTDTSIVVVGHVVSGVRPAPDVPYAELLTRTPDDLVIDRDARVIRVDGDEVDLTYREFELLDHLVSAPGRVQSRRQLLAAVWDRYSEDNLRTVDVHMLRLRRKLGRHAQRLVTVRNVGYKYQPPR